MPPHRRDGGRHRRIDNLLAVIDRQANEGTWSYGVLYDSRRVSSVASQTDVRAGLKHVEVLSRTHDHAVRWRS